MTGLGLPSDYIIDHFLSSRELKCSTEILGQRFSKLFYSLQSPVFKFKPFKWLRKLCPRIPGCCSSHGLKRSMMQSGGNVGMLGLYKTTYQSYRINLSLQKCFKKRPNYLVFIAFCSQHFQSSEHEQLTY